MPDLSRMLTEALADWKEEERGLVELLDLVMEALPEGRRVLGAHAMLTFAMHRLQYEMGQQTKRQINTFREMVQRVTRDEAAHLRRAERL